MTTAIAFALLLMAGAARAQDDVRPAHPAVRYSCMGALPAGEPMPWVDAGVPYAIEVMHPGYTITRFDRFTSPGLRLFRVVGGRRETGASERVASVEAVDEAGRPVLDRALFVRLARDTARPYDLAGRAMAVLLRRADESPLVPARAAEIHERVRARIAEPSVDADGVTLRFWVRVHGASPYAHEVRVDLRTGVALGGG